MPEVVASVPVLGSVVQLRMACDFRKQADLCTFSYSQDGKVWTQIGAPIHLRYELSHFMGCRFGLFNFASKQTGGHADFDFFRIGS